MGRFEYQGYSFATAKEMDLAKKEAESIEYIKAKIDYKDRDKLKKMYDSLVEKQSFITPVGVAFMKEMYQEISMFSAQPVSGVPVTVPIELKQGGKLTKEWKDKSEAKSKAKKEIYEVKLRNSRIINAFLIVLIIAMFAVVIFGKNSPFQDAEEKIQDKYATWEEELNQREQALDIREQGLN